MNIDRMWTALGAALLLAAPAAIAQSGDPCVPPGEIVIEDPAGDNPDGNDFTDLEFLGIAEPAALPGKLVFTMKVRGLSQTPPMIRWAVQFNSDAPLPDGAEGWFVMLTTEDGTPRLVYGMTTLTVVGVVSVRLYEELGELSEGSGFNAEGTITMIVEKAAVGNPQPGEELFNIFPVIRTLLTPNGFTFDQSPGTAVYSVIGNETCAEGKSFLGIGALPWGTLLLMALAGFLAAGVRRRRTTIY